MKIKTIVLSIPDDKIANHLFTEFFANTCESSGVSIRYEPYDMDIFNELNLKALEIEKAHALIELEEEILNARQCINGTCED